MATETTSWVGQVLSGDRYQVIAKLGEGGMGFVYRARDRHLGCDVVVKVPRPALLQEPGFAARFDQEIRSLVRLVHPHIVKISDVGKHDGVPFAVMQYLPGGSLHDRQQPAPDGTCRPQSAEDLRTWLLEAASALDFIHGQHYVHRDIKPDNILFDAHGNVYLSDFGIAKVVAGVAGPAGPEKKTALTNAGMVLGTAPYMAPEVLMGRPYDGHADQYALAVTVYHLLSGTLPYDGPTPAAIMMQHARDTAPPLHDRLPTLPKALAMAVHKGMHRDPRRRFPTCGAFAEAVLAAALDQPLRARTVAPRDKSATTAKPPTADGVSCPGCHKRFRLPPTAPNQRVCCPACKGVYRAEELREFQRTKRPGSKHDLHLGEQAPWSMATEKTVGDEGWPDAHADPDTFASAPSRTAPLPPKPARGKSPAKAADRLRRLPGFGWLSRYPDGAVYAAVALAVPLLGLLVWLLLSAFRSSPTEPEVAAVVKPPGDVVVKAPGDAEPKRQKLIKEDPPQAEVKQPPKIQDKPPADKDKQFDLSELQEDGRPQIEYAFGALHTFGAQAIVYGAGKPAYNKLTSATNGLTNSTSVRIDGRDFLIGSRSTGGSIDHNPIPPDSLWDTRGGMRSIWGIPDARNPQLRFTQTVEKVLSKQPVSIGGGKYRRVADTLLIRFRLENLDRRPHKVALRTVVDTMIGQNDGVPFAGPGLARVINTCEDFHTTRVPDFLQALERPNVEDPGTVALMTLKLGRRLEPPVRVSLTSWSATHTDTYKDVRQNDKVVKQRDKRLWQWEAAVVPMGTDSAVVLYWTDRVLEPGEKCEVGFAYGLGRLAAAKGKGRLAVSLGGSFGPGEVFHVLAYVHDPVPGQTLKLVLPKGSGLALVEGDEQLRVRPRPQGAEFGYSTVSWKVKGERPGRYDLEVRSSEGDAQAHPVWIFAPSPAEPPPAVGNKKD